MTAGLAHRPVHGCAPLVEAGLQFSFSDDHDDCNDRTPGRFILAGLAVLVGAPALAGSIPDTTGLAAERVGGLDARTRFGRGREGPDRGKTVAGDGDGGSFAAAGRPRYSPLPHHTRQSRGGMAEWFKAPVLKTGGRKPRGFESYSLRQIIVWRGGRVAEGSRLLSG